MLSKYQYLLLSTCVTAIGFSSYATLPAYAGFEWTPPEKEITTPLVVDEAVVNEDLPPVALDKVLPEPIADIVTTKDKVDVIIPLEEKADISVEGDIIVEDKAKEIVEEKIEVKSTDGNVIEEIKVEEVIVDSENIDIPNPKITSEDTGSKEAISEKIIDEAVVVDRELKDIAKTPVQKEESEPEISLFPLDSDNDLKVTEGDTIVLSPDMEEEDLSERITIEDPVSEIPQETIIWNEAETFNVIEGFGSDMPLALALRQIVPAKYAFLFGKNVNAGAAISWNGGKPWNEVLKDALDPLGVTFEIKGKKIILSSNSNTPSVVVEEKVTISPVKEDLVEESAEANKSGVVDLGENKGVELEIEEIVIKEDTNSATTSNDVDEFKYHDQINEVEVSAEDIVDEQLKPVAKGDIVKGNPVDMKAGVDDFVEGVDAKTINIKDEVKIEEPAIKEDNLIEIIDIEEKVEISPPVMAEPNPENVIEVEEVEVKRKSVLDPGEFKSYQPVKQEPIKQGIEPLKSGEILDEKKNLETKIEEIKQPVAIVEESKVEEIIIDNNAKIDSIMSPDLNSTEQEIVFYDDVVASDVKSIDIKNAGDVVGDIESTTTTIEAPKFRQSPSNIIKVWEAKKNTDLKKLLFQWAAEENIKITWNSSKTYRLDKDIFISGTFKNALEVIFSKGLRNAPNYVIGEGSLYELRVSD